MLKLLKRFFNKKNKIIYIINSLELGGAENILFNIVNMSNKKDIVIISLTSKGFYGSALIKKGYKVYELKMKKDFLFLFNFTKLIALLINQNPKIVHTWMYHSNLIGGIAAKLLGINEIYWSIHHDFEYANIIKFLEMKLLSFLSYFIPKKIIYCSTSSQFNHNLNGYKEDISCIIKNGISVSKFQSDKKLREIIRRQLKINQNCLLLGNVSRYHPIKDHDTLLKALLYLKKLKVNFKCILIGNGLTNTNIDLIKKITRFKLKKEIILFGKSDKVHILFNAFDLNILSSKSESSHLTLIESMACGIPCLSTKVGDALDIIGDTGWIVDTENPKAMADCIHKISNKKYLLKRKSLKAVNRVKKYYTLEKMYSNYQRLYN